MTSVLVVEPEPTHRIRLEDDLRASNQFGEVLSCETIVQAGEILGKTDINVMLVDSVLASNAENINQIKTDYPELGLVLLTEKDQRVDSKLLSQMGLHAQTSRLASSIELMVCVAKAMAKRLKPPSKVGKKLLGRLLKD